MSKRVSDALDILRGRKEAVTVEVLTQAAERMTGLEAEVKTLAVANEEIVARTQSLAVELDGLRTRGPAIRIPSTGPSFGARFGEFIDDDGRQFAAEREPVGVRVTEHVAVDVFDNWFEAVDTNDEGDKDLDTKVQAVLQGIGAKQQLIRACTAERTFGEAVLICGYNDVQSALDFQEPLREGAQLMQIYAYGKRQIEQTFKVTNPEDPRLGLPEYYVINMNLGAGVKYHWSRVIHCATRLRAHPFEGISVLDPIWDDMTAFRNIRWGMGQTMYRYGSGFPHIQLKGEPDQIKQWQAEGRFTDIFNRTYFVSGLEEKFEFKGAAGAALNPTPYYEAELENISIGSDIPKTHLRGAQAGTLTGSEVNERSYFKYISSQQTLWSPMVEDLIHRLIVSGQVETTAEDFKLEWLGAFELSPETKSTVELTLAQANVERLKYMSINEVRNLEGLEEIEGGEVVPGLLEIQMKGIVGVMQKPPETKTSMLTSDQVGNAPHFVRMQLEDKINALRPRVISGEISRDQAYEAVRSLVIEFQLQTEQAAIDTLSQATGRAITSLPDESKDFYEQQAEYYMKYFAKQLDDWVRLSNGGVQ